MKPMATFHPRLIDALTNSQLGVTRAIVGRGKRVSAGIGSRGYTSVEWRSLVIDHFIKGMGPIRKFVNSHSANLGCANLPRKSPTDPPLLGNPPPWKCADTRLLDLTPLALHMPSNGSIRSWLLLPAPSGPSATLFRAVNFAPYPTRQ